MRNDKHLALKLRKSGKSYNKISKELDIPKSTLSDWFSEMKWSREIKIDLTRRANYIARKRLRLINKKRRGFWEQRREQFRKDAKKEFPALLKNSLFIAGINLYWGEGDSKLSNGIVRLSNTSPAMIAIYSKFLRNVLRVPPEKLRAELILYPDLHEEHCKNFWRTVTRIPENQFYKTQFIFGKHPTKRSKYGICMVMVGSRDLKEKIHTWIELFAEKYGVRE